MVAPLILNIVPTDGSTDVAITQSIQFQFDTALDPTSVNSGTVVVTDLTTLDNIIGNISLNSIHTIVIFRPLRALLPNHSYEAAIIGLDLALPAGNIKSSGGDDLVATSKVEFLTAIDRYVPLDEVSTMEDVEIIGPIRADTITAQSLVASELEITETSPADFDTEVDVNTSQIVISFPTGIDLSFIDNTALSVEGFPVLGMEEYYAKVDPNKTNNPLTMIDDRLTLMNCYTGVPSTFYLQPTGTVSVSGNQVIWTKQPDVEFLHNSEVRVTIDKDKVKGIDGSELPADIVVVFTTEYFPLFISAKLVRVRMAPAIANLYDNTINQIIFANSLEAWEQAGYKFDIYSPYPAVKRYVLAKTILDIFDVMEAKDQLLRDEKKVLGDLSISRGPSGGTKSAYYQKLEADMDKWLFELRSYRGQGMPTHAIPGVRSATYRGDFRMRTWDHLKNPFALAYRADLANVPAANLRDDRTAINLLAFDHDGWSEATIQDLAANGTLLYTSNGLFACPE